MKIKNKEIEFEAGRLTKYINLLPWITIRANRNIPKWQDCAIEMGWIMWAIAFRVKPINKMICSN